MVSQNFHYFKKQMMKRLFKVNSYEKIIFKFNFKFAINFFGNFKSQLGISLRFLIDILAFIERKRYQFEICVFTFILHYGVRTIFRVRIILFTLVFTMKITDISPNLLLLFSP
jgi:hypothetical protein